MKYNKIPENTFKELQMNAGMLIENFNPEDGSFQMKDLIGATSGGMNFKATPTFTDFAEDIDNAPKNMKEFKQLETWLAEMTGTFASVSAKLAKMLVGAGQIDETNESKIVPRNDLDKDDFKDIWLVGDYSDVTTGNSAGFLAIHLMNALNTGGFQIQTTDKQKGKFAFNFTGHYSITDQDKVPFEIYVKAGESASTASELAEQSEE